MIYVAVQTNYFLINRLHFFKLYIEETLIHKRFDAMIFINFKTVSFC